MKITTNHLFTYITKIHNRHNIKVLRVYYVKILALGAVKDFSERLSELGVEDGVDNWVEEGVDITQPSGQDEDRDSWGVVEAELGANRVQDGASEERRPAE